MRGVLAAVLFALLSVADAATVREIKVVNAGKGAIDESSVRANVKTAVDAEFDQNALSADVRKLLDTGRYESVDATVEKTADGVRVTLRIRPNRRLDGEVAVTGAEHFAERDLVAWLGIYPGDPVSDAILGARVQKLLEEYRSDFYPDAAVTWTIKDVDEAAGSASVVVMVREGARAWIQTTQFPGAEAISHARLKTALNMRSWYNPMRLFRRDRFDASDVELGRLTIREWYAELGYLDAKVGAAEVTKLAGGGVSVSIPVIEGPQYRVGGVSFEGAERFPENQLLVATRLKGGKTATAGALETAAQGVRNHYSSKGYVDTAVQPLLSSVPSNAIVDVRFVIRESEKVSIRNIRIRGNAVTRDKVIRRELTVYPGDILNEVEASKSERRLQNLGFFSSVRHYPEETTSPNERDLIYEVEEGRSGSMMVGAGFSSVDHMMLFMDITHGNFDISGWPYRGGGQKLKLSAQLGGSRKDVSISFTEPWFMDRRLQLGTELYHTDVDYDDYDVRRYGGAISLTKGLFGKVRGTVQYRLERESVTDVADTNEYMFVDGTNDVSATGYVDPYGGTNRFPFAAEEDRLSSSLRLGLSYDDRDHPFIPRNGLQASVYFQVTGGPMGGDTDLYQTGFKAAYYISPWLGHVLSLQASYDTVESYGDTEDVPIGSRLFAGGGRTIRGFGYRHVGPKVAPVTGDTIDPENYRPYGGNSRAVGNVEYTIPLFSMLRFAVFYDTGNVWRESFDVDLADLASSAGFGFRFDIPGFPMRIDRAWVLHKDEDLTEEDIVVFWIGY